ncbi:hypothetical protein CTAYLR_005233 [Chrysophaeum taylorii]|uniref:Polygalacturonase n=1 Tax=Chrysophaeum taylorii TaxID=2483200 RepID=A0AAD7UAZ8_9STRA|nr:hypothetical protein CTAYLR_005233 [Chrysophaeum taylorii]
MEFGAPRMCTLQAWLNGTNATSELQAAIDECGDLPEGGVVVVSLGLTLHTASLWLRSNLTLRVEGTLVGTATGRGNKTDPANTNATDAPMVYTRRESTMRWAHAGLLNGGRCVRLKDPLVGWGDCAEWTKLENVVVEGGGILDANAKGWFSDKQDDFDEKTRPIMLDLLWVRGLTIRDLRIIRPGYWTVHPCFCDNVRVENNSIVTSGGNTDGVDPDSTWNVYIAGNILSTGDDCIALKSGRDWSGRMVNISTRNVMIENNTFLKGYSGVAIGSETSAWIEDIVVRNARFDTAEYAIKIKSARGRGGGARNVTLRNLQGIAEDTFPRPCFDEM